MHDIHRNERHKADAVRVHPKSRKAPDILVAYVHHRLVRNPLPKPHF